MTIVQLHQITADLIAKGHGADEVYVSKSTFNSALEEDGCTILPVESAARKRFELMDDDGFTLTTPRGRIETETGLVLSGE